VSDFQHFAVAARSGNGWFGSLGIVIAFEDNAQGDQMAKAYYSTVFSQPADDIWNVIRANLSSTAIAGEGDHAKRGGGGAGAQRDHDDAG
jgi:hypothetical protein